MAQLNTVKFSYEFPLNFRVFDTARLDTSRLKEGMPE